MTTAYSGAAGDGRLGIGHITELPVRATLSDGTPVEVGPFTSQGEMESGRELMNLIIREGKAWPFDEEFATLDSYASYFLTHAAFVVRSPTEVVGTFYVKPNFPGRCSHICNGGFITAPQWRRRGVGRLMGRCFLLFAKRLGYRASYFNLVFKSNTASVRLWDSLGFQKVAEIPHCADLEGVPALDTAYGYYFDLDTLPPNFHPLLTP